MPKFTFVLTNSGNNDYPIALLTCCGCDGGDGVGGGDVCVVSCTADCREETESLLSPQMT